MCGISKAVNVWPRWNWVPVSDLERISLQSRPIGKLFIPQPESGATNSKILRAGANSSLAGRLMLLCKCSMSTAENCRTAGAHTARGNSNAYLIDEWGLFSDLRRRAGSLRRRLHKNDEPVERSNRKSESC